MACPHSTVAPLLLAGSLAVFPGISALSEDDDFVMGPKCIDQFDLATWAPNSASPSLRAF